MMQTLHYLILVGFFTISACAQGMLPLTGGHAFVRGQQYHSASGDHYLVFQRDGNLVVYTSAGGYVWGLNETSAEFWRAARVEMQDDGNLAVYDADGQWIWSALHQNPDPSAQLVLTAKGALELVSESRGVLWSSNADFTTEVNPNQACVPSSGWTHCRIMSEPKIKILGSAAVSLSALDLAEHVSTEITSRLAAKYPADKFDNYVVYITNGEPWSDLRGLAPVGTMMDGGRTVGAGDELRGGAGGNYLWISEQMICKRGVQTRNDAYEAGLRDKRDDDDRTFD